MKSPSSSSKMPPWSFTALTAFETCPRRYYLTRVSKDVVEPQTEATIWGNRVHKALENRLSKNTQLPDYLSSYEPILSKIDSKAGKKLVEERMTLDKSFRPTTWMSESAWCRGVVDVGVIGDKKATILDWKTGKRKMASDQLKLFAGLAFAHYPWLEQVSTGFVWLKENTIDKAVFTRDQIPTLWQEFLPRVQRMEHAYSEAKWPALPSGLCRNWCPCTTCEFCGKQ